MRKLNELCLVSTYRDSFKSLLQVGRGVHLGHAHRKNWKSVGIRQQQKLSICCFSLMVHIFPQTLTVLWPNLLICFCPNSGVSWPEAWVSTITRKWWPSVSFYCRSGWQPTQVKSRTSN